MVQALGPQAEGESKAPVSQLIGELDECRNVTVVEWKDKRNCGVFLGTVVKKTKNKHILMYW